jgi:pimeloyl-ACP methyl ester carboxylesterase
MRRIYKIALRTIAGFVLLYIMLAILGAVLVMHIPRLPVTDSPTSLGLTYSDVSFPSRDNYITLKGWYLPGQGEKTILVVHGGFQNRVDEVVDTLGLAHDLVIKGYNVLLFDLRGRGESTGKGLSMMTNEQDIGGAIDYLKSKGYSTSNIDVIGFCSGAASSAIFISGENVGAVVLDGCFATVRNMVTSQATTKGVPKSLLDFFYPGLSVAVKIFYGYTPINPIDTISNATCPILFMHEENDNLVSLQEVDQLFKASKNPSNILWEVNGALHSEGYKSNPALYIDEVDKFIQSVK